MLLRTFDVTLVVLVGCLSVKVNSDDLKDDIFILPFHKGNIKDIRDEADNSLMKEGRKEAVPWASPCPPPPPVLPPHSTACKAIPCSANIDCHPRHNHTYLCCFNGCTDTCMRALDPPAVIDWIEDLSEKPTLIVPGKVEHQSGAPESVALPGGCIITLEQFLDLEQFKQDHQHVSECFCHVGEVFCKVVQ